MDAFDAIVAKLAGFVGGVLEIVGRAVAPVMGYIEASEHTSALKAGGTVFLLAAGAVLLFFRISGMSNSDDGDDSTDDLPDSFVFAKMIMKVFYPLLIIYLAMTSVKGHAVVELVPMTFDNFAQWYETNQFFGGVVVFEFLLVSALCVLRLKPLRLIRYWVLTADYLILGLLLGKFYLFLVELLSNFWLGSLLVYLLGLFLDTPIPFLFVGTAVAPIYAFLFGIGSVFVRFFQSFTFQLETKSGRTYRGNALFLLMDQLLP